tara:strand:- start:1605 stop:1961 length:357 start_codon:yes stop_codon:yes gene_type:complete
MLLELITQDPDANLNYWLDLSRELGSLTVVDFAIDPESELAEATELTITKVGVNYSELTDDDGNVYPIGKVLGIKLSGGNHEETYVITIRFTLNSGESDDLVIVFKPYDPAIKYMTVH